MVVKGSKKSKLTRSQQHVLIGCLLFGHVPAAFQASVDALKHAGLVKPSSIGNIVLTPSGRLVAVGLHRKYAGRLGLLKGRK